MPDQKTVRLFAKLMESDDEEINLAEAALLIARTEYPELDLSLQLSRLDRMAREVPTDPEGSGLGNVVSLNEYLFEREKFAGNEDEYDDPRNSFLNDVLDRKKGIPITLSLIYMELARRRGLPVSGVGFPGHFLVKYATGSGEIIIDPYNKGAVLTRKDCEERLKKNFGEDAEFRPEFLAAATTKQILSRMLNNLKGSYFRRRNFLRVLRMIEMGQAIDPGSREGLRDRGMVYLLMGRYAEARADLMACAALSPPDDPNLKEIKSALARLRAMMN
ncbi:MAG: transglutaminase family protein [Acidobacteria bacterium]|nr:transglutaminase family protein [Acidobacteriota bacterium]